MSVLVPGITEDRVSKDYENRRTFCVLCYHLRNVTPEPLGNEIIRARVSPFYRKGVGVSVVSSLLSGLVNGGETGSRERW